MTVEKKRLTFLTSLEVFISSLFAVLYIRRLYPQDSFCRTRFLGVQCRSNRHPEVVKYISKTVEMAVSALMAGDSEEISVIIYDQQERQDFEKFSLNFDPPIIKPTQNLLDLEAEMRNLILSVQTLEGLKSWKWPPETTFRIMLFVKTAEHNSNELRESLTTGHWYCHQSGTELRSSERRRPVHDMGQSGARFYIQMMDPPP